MNQQAKRIKELFGYARTLTKEQGIGTMCVPRGGNLPHHFYFNAAVQYAAKLFNRISR